MAISPTGFRSLDELEDKMSEPSSRLIQDFSQLEGDIMVLGVGGKMGPSLAKLAIRACEATGKKVTIYGVSRFSQPGLKEELEKWGIQTLKADLLEEEQLSALPQVANVLYLAGTKFGTQTNQSLTWALNTYVPGRVAATFRDSRIVVFSTGNVYPFVPTSTQGATETTPPDPVGEYAQSCLGRERMFEYFSHKYHTPTLIFRLNYAIDLRYGVLLDVAKAVANESPIDLRMGHVNVIWQGDANEYALRSLFLCDSPPAILNVTGPETVSIQWLAQQFGVLLDKEPQFVHEPQPTALLSDAAKSHQSLGLPHISLPQMIEWTADWVQQGGEDWGKPTHYQQRSGNF